MSPLAHEVLTLAAVFVATGWLLRHFLRRETACNGCTTAGCTPPRPPRRRSLPVLNSRVLDDRALNS